MYSQKFKGYIDLNKGYYWKNSTNLDYGFRKNVKNKWKNMDKIGSKSSSDAENITTMV